MTKILIFLISRENPYMSLFLFTYSSVCLPLGKPIFGQKKLSSAEIRLKNPISCEIVNFGNYLTDYHCM